MCNGNLEAVLINHSVFISTLSSRYGTSISQTFPEKYRELCPVNILGFFRQIAWNFRRKFSEPFSGSIYRFNMSYIQGLFPKKYAGFFLRNAKVFFSGTSTAFSWKLFQSYMKKYSEHFRQMSRAFGLDFKYLCWKVSRSSAQKLPTTHYLSSSISWCLI